MVKTTAMKKSGEKARLLQAFESGYFRRAGQRALQVRQLMQAARATVKDRRLNILLPPDANTIIAAMRVSLSSR
jgi:hypothetical protein